VTSLGEKRGGMVLVPRPDAGALGVDSPPEVSIPMKLLLVPFHFRFASMKLTAASSSASWNSRR
jgi:hypothetical protein